jgi:hypothetical protein
VRLDGKKLLAAGRGFVTLVTLNPETGVATIQQDPLHYTTDWGVGGASGAAACEPAPLVQVDVAELSELPTTWSTGIDWTGAVFAQESEGGGGGVTFVELAAPRAEANTLGGGDTSGGCDQQGGAGSGSTGDVDSTDGSDGHGSGHGDDCTAAPRAGSAAAAADLSSGVQGAVVKQTDAAECELMSFKLAQVLGVQVPPLAIVSKYLWEGRQIAIQLQELFFSGCYKRASKGTGGAGNRHSPFLSVQEYQPGTTLRGTSPADVTIPRHHPTSLASVTSLRHYPTSPAYVTIPRHQLTSLSVNSLRHQLYILLNCLQTFSCLFGCSHRKYALCTSYERGFCTHSMKWVLCTFPPFAATLTENSNLARKRSVSPFEQAPIPSWLGIHKLIGMHVFSLFTG